MDLDGFEVTSSYGDGLYDNSWDMTAYEVENGFDDEYEVNFNDEDLAAAGGIIAAFLAFGAVAMIISAVISLVTIIASWKMYAKGGKPGWACLVPIYNMIALSEIVYGNGGKIFLLLVPIYNFYFIFRFSIDLAHAYGKGTGFGILYVFFAPIATWILGFGSAQAVTNGNATDVVAPVAPEAPVAPVAPEAPVDNNNQMM